MVYVVIFIYVPTTWLLTLPFLLTTYRSNPVKISAWSQCKGSVSPGGFSSLCHVQKLLRNLSMSWGLFKLAGSSWRISSLFRMKFTGLPNDESWYSNCTAFIIARTNLISSLSVSLGKFTVMCLYKSLSTNTAVSTNIAGKTALLCLFCIESNLLINVLIVLFLWAKSSLSFSKLFLSFSIVLCLASLFRLCFVQIWDGLLLNLSKSVLSTHVLSWFDWSLLFRSVGDLLTITWCFPSSLWNLSGKGCMK